MNAVLYDKISTKIEQSKTITVHFVGIVASGLVSGCYYNGGGRVTLTV